MEALIKVKRFNPEESEDTYFQDYSIDVAEDSTILDSLIKIREQQDGTLSLRCSCRASICGSCSMRVNGSAKLVCKTRIKEVSPDGEPITVEPMGNFPVIKDLVTEMDSFWSKMKSVDPYVKTSFEPEAEHIASNESMTHLLGVMNCIMCGACVSECTALEVDPTFTGPAALAKAYRFVVDPRDEETNSRLGNLNENMGGGPPGASSPTRGVWGGNCKANDDLSNIIDYVEFATLGDAVDFGDLSVTRGQCSGFSNAHGGL